jgi:REP element-mobilizing transposase RayT
MEFGEVYFWTSTIHQWKHLLKSDEIKELITSSLSNLSLRKKIAVYGFVIMPNHIHLLWELLEMNGKEMPHTSFQKFTAHTFQKYLQQTLPNELIKYQVIEGERSHRYWQRDPLAIRVFNRKMFEQKLNYIHNNPLQLHWGLANNPSEYNYSSAAFYENGHCKFEFLTHYLDKF